jgi:predicted nuclease of predicted toxin-antitoxin system
MENGQVRLDPTVAMADDDGLLYEAAARENRIVLPAVTCDHDFGREAIRLQHSNQV